MSRRRTYTARAVRSGGWWAITVPDLKGVHSQARRLDQAQAMAREAIGLFLDVAPDTVDVSVEPVLPDELQSEVTQVRSVRDQAEALQREAVEATAQAAKSLVREAHLTVREAGQILGLSHQRVAQLLNS